jgi:hypothetical protein
VRRQVPEPVLAEEGRAVHGALPYVLRQVPGVRALGALRQQGRVPLLQGHEVAREPAPQVPLGPPLTIPVEAFRVGVYLRF